MSKTNVSTVTPFHTSVYAAAMANHKAGVTMADKMQALVTSKYGTTSPTYEQYRTDQAVLASMAKEKGLKDNQWVRKPYAAAVKAVFKELPVAQTAAAILKRSLREKNGAPKKGAVKNAVSARNSSSGDQIEQFIAKAGVMPVLAALTKILAAENATKEAANALVAVQAGMIAKAA